MTKTTSEVTWSVHFQKGRNGTFFNNREKKNNSSRQTKRKTVIFGIIVERDFTASHLEEKNSRTSILFSDMLMLHTVAQWMKVDSVPGDLTSATLKPFGRLISASDWRLETLESSFTARPSSDGGWWPPPFSSSQSGTSHLHTCEVNTPDVTTATYAALRAATVNHRRCSSCGGQWGFSTASVSLKLNKLLPSLSFLDHFLVVWCVYCIITQVCDFGKHWWEPEGLN